MFRSARLPIAAAATALGLALLGAAPPSADEAAIRATIQHYFDGGMSVRKAFHPSAQMSFVADTGYSVVPIETYLTRVEEGFRRNPNATGWTEKRIASIDVTGDAAVAKLALGNERMAVTDYMTLLRIDGTWLIVNKSFTRQAKAE